MSELVQNFFKAINTISQANVDAAKNDVTIDAEIASMVNVDIGQYKVTYQGNSFDAFASDPLTTYKVGEQVYVLVPQGDFSQRKVILGRSAYKNNSTFSDRQDMTNFYIDKGPNWLDAWYELGTPTPLQICAVKGDQKHTLDHQDGAGANFTDYGFMRNLPEDSSAVDRHPTDWMTPEQLAVADEMMQRYSKAYTGIKIQASFETNFNSVHDSGQYALVVELLETNPLYITDPTHPDAVDHMGADWVAAKQALHDYQETIDQSAYETDPDYKAQVDANIAALEEAVAAITPLQNPYKIATLQLGFSSFSGAPYAYTEPTPQKAYFSMNAGSIKGLNRVYLMQDGNFMADVVPEINDDGTVSYHVANTVLNRNNIFCHDIDLRFCDKVNLTDTLYYPWIETPYGDSVYDAGTQESNMAGRPSVTLIAHLQYGYEDILDEESCQVIWFKEDARVTENFALLQGWEKDDHGKTYYDYGGPGWYPVDLLIEEALGTITWDDQGNQVANRFYDIDFNQLYIRKEAIPFKYNYKAVIVYRDIGTTEMREITKVEAIQEVNRLDSPYDLELVQETGNGGRDVILRIKNKKKPYDEVNPATGENYRDWFGTWYLKSQAGAYYEISDPFVLGGFKVNDWLFDDVATFYVQCYDPYIIDPDNTGRAVMQTDEVALLMKIIITAQAGDLLVDWEGKDSFNYDALGTIRGDADTRDNLLQPVIKWIDGRASDYLITVIGPDGVTPLSNKEYYDRTSETHSGLAFNWKDASGNNKCMMKNMWVDFENGIHFQVESQYVEQRAAAKNNTFTIKVETLSGETYEVKKTISFYKDGDMGTIGSDWVAPIRPCNWKFGPDKEEGPYIEQLDYPAPLLVQVQEQPDGTDKLVQDKNYRTFLRPFVTKNGIPLENLDPFEGYFCKVYWDVRMPGYAAQQDVKYASWLRLHHTDGTPSDVDNPGNIYGREKSWYETGQVELGNNILSKDKWNSKVNDLEKEPDGLVAFTMYPRKQYAIEDNTGEYATENYGALEVRFFDNAHDGTGASLESCMYRFIVKAQVDIMKGQYDQETKQIRVEGDIERIASITSFYPVDVMINYSGYEFNDPYNYPQYYEFNKRIATNWPRFVAYNATGYDPANLEEALYFRFGPKLDKETLNYKAYNLTPLTQTIENQLNPSNPMDNPYDQYYRAKAHLNMTEGFHGALIYDVQEQEGPWGKNWYIRNQVMYLNAYGNVDINGWDGQGIDMNEEDGTIFANTIGAGYKVPQTNAFTGVLMGIDKSQKKADVGGYTGSYDDEAYKHMQYMTGIYGYQDGVSSFGIMENGTAFFGRADRGGRIIIDGANATIYGGANGIMDSPSIADPMWNTMRLSLVDLNHSTSQMGKNVDGFYVYNFNDKYYRRNDDGTYEELSQAERDKIGPIFTGIKNGEKGFMTQGFNGKYFTLDSGTGPIAPESLPAWYAKLWQKAYVKPDRAVPYWLESPNDSDRLYDELEWYSEAYATEDGHLPTDRDGVNYKINYFGGDPTVTDDEFHSRDSFDLLFHAKADMDGEVGEDGYLKVNGSQQLSGFGPSRASTTPAIEIGQHMHGLMPGLLGWDEYEDIFRTLSIPGDRNFLVTYDGTLWAMNGVFMGAVIGSNIVGGRIQGAEIGIGQSIDDNLQSYTMDGDGADRECRYDSLWPPIDGLETIKKKDTPGSGLAFYVDAQGNVTAKSIKIYGGSIDMGRFHILGGTGLDDPDYGHLVQIAESDFIGPTHFYGNIAIGPSLRNSRQGFAKEGSSEGNMFQTRGLVALGIPVPDGDDESIHKDFILTQRSNIEYNYARGSISTGDPGIGEHPNAEQSAMFAIDSATSDIPRTIEDTGYFQGHFWPMHFHYGGEVTEAPEDDYATSRVNAYMTTMDIFQSKGHSITTGTGTDLDVLAGQNYFRVGPFGTETMMMFIRKNHQDQAKSEYPRPDNGVAGGGKDNYLGWFGLQNRSGYGESSGDNFTQYSLGISSWYTAPIILSSDGESAWNTRGHIHMFAQGYGGNVGTDNTWADSAQTGPDDARGWGCFFNMGSDYNAGGSVEGGDKEGQYNKIRFWTHKGTFAVGVTKQRDQGARGTVAHPWSDVNFIYDSNETVAGLWINPYGVRHAYGGGVGLWTGDDGKDTELHIVHKGTKIGQDCIGDNSDMTEILMDKDSIYMYARKKIVMVYGVSGSAHKAKKDAATTQRPQTVIDATEEGVEISNDKSLCIFLTDDNKQGPEITMKPNAMHLTGPVVKIGHYSPEPHNPANYMQFGSTKVGFHGTYADENNQYNIYARFA